VAVKRSLAALVVAVMVAVVGVAPGAAQNNSNQTGLVNVSLGDVNLLNDVNLAVAANVAATVCNVAVPVAVLAQQVIANNGQFSCDTAAGPLTVDQSQNGPPTTQPGAGGNNSNQSGLVNVSLGDVNILNNVNAAVAANVAVTACNLAIPVAVLAVQIIDNGGTYTCNTTSGPLDVTQAL
jgi:hypothetical protein